MKGIEFDQYSSPVIAEPKLRLIVAIAATYYITIGIADVTNDFQNTLKASHEREIIDCPPQYTYWFKLRFHTILIEPDYNMYYGIDIWLGMKGTKAAELQWNTILNLVFSYLLFVKHIIDHDIYPLQEKTTKDFLIVGYYTDDFLCT